MRQLHGGETLLPQPSGSLGLRDVVIRGLDVRVRVEVKGEVEIWKVEERQVFHAQFTLVKVAARRGVEAMMI